MVGSPFVFIAAKALPAFVSVERGSEEFIEVAVMILLFCTHSWASFRQMRRVEDVDAYGCAHFFLLFFGGFALMGLLGFAILIALIMIGGGPFPV